MLVMPQKEADLFASTRARLPENQRAGFDAFMKEYMDFGSLFQKSESDLVAMDKRFGEYYQSAITLPQLNQGEPGGWMAWAMYVSMGQQHDYRPALKKVNAPVLVIHGANDLQSEEASRQYSNLFPHAQFVVISNAGHFSFEEQPEQFAKAISSFLEIE